MRTNTPFFFFEHFHLKLITLNSRAIDLSGVRFIALDETDKLFELNKRGKKDDTTDGHGKHMDSDDSNASEEENENENETLT